MIENVSSLSVSFVSSRILSSTVISPFVAAVVIFPFIVCSTKSALEVISLCESFAVIDTEPSVCTALTSTSTLSIIIEVASVIYAFDSLLLDSLSIDRFKWFVLSPIELEAFNNKLLPVIIEFSS